MSDVVRILTPIIIFIMPAGIGIYIKSAMMIGASKGLCDKGEISEEEKIKNIKIVTKVMSVYFLVLLATVISVFLII